MSDEKTTAHLPEIERIESNPVHNQFRTEMSGVIRYFAGDLPPEQMLALMAQECGKLLALQDPNKYTVTAAMAMISQNIQIGNLEAVKAMEAALAPNDNGDRG